MLSSWILFAALAGFCAAESSARVSSTTVSSLLNRCPVSIPRDQYLVVHNELCYSFVMYRKSDYADAENDCRLNGGILAVIRDQATQNFIFQTIQKLQTGSQGVWIGLEDRKNEGSYVWSDGTPVGYENWGSDDGPNNYFGSSVSDCVAMDPSTGVWEDFHCENDFWSFFQDVDNSYICQFALR